MSTPKRERRPRAEAPSAGFASHQAAESTSEFTARPRPVTLIGPALYHLLIGNGYAITGVCRACGAPLTNRKSVAAGVGPVCGKRVVSNG